MTGVKRAAGSDTYCNRFVNGRKVIYDCTLYSFHSFKNHTLRFYLTMDDKCSTLKPLLSHASYHMSHDLGTVTIFRLLGLGLEFGFEKGLGLRLRLGLGLVSNHITVHQITERIAN